LLSRQPGDIGTFNQLTVQINNSGGLDNKATAIYLSRLSHHA
jgi:hypothetical protein